MRKSGPTVIVSPLFFYTSNMKKGKSTISEHLKNILLDDELDEVSVCRKFRRTN
ncbi:MAG: hypothetical protein RSD40_03470 [Bacilli bacterium]